VAGRPADSGADRLNHDHEGIGQQQGPCQPKTELCAGLRVSSDPTRVVVGGPRDQARPEYLAEAFPDCQGTAIGHRALIWVPPPWCRSRWLVPGGVRKTTPAIFEPTLT